MFELGIEAQTVLGEEVRVLINQLPEDRRQHFLDRLKICQQWAARGVEGDDAVANACLRELRVDVGLEVLRAGVGLPALKPSGQFESPGPKPVVPPPITTPPTTEPKREPEPKPTPFPTGLVVFGILAGTSVLTLLTLFATGTVSLMVESAPAPSPPEDTGPAPLLLDHLWMN